MAEVEIEGEIKAWGNSAGILIPKKTLEEADLKKGDKIKMKIQKKSLLGEIRGALKDVEPKEDIPLDDLLEEADEGWR